MVNQTQMQYITVQHTSYKARSPSMGANKQRTEHLRNQRPMRLRQTFNITDFSET